MENNNKNIVLIIGGTSGIGKGIVERFLRSKEYFVVFSGNNYKKGIETKKEMLKISSSVEYKQVDIKSADSVKKLIRDVVKNYGKLDVCCNSAGKEHRFSLMSEISEDEFDEIININLKGTWLCMKYQIKQMMRQKKGGVIINISSVSGNKSTPNGVIYSSSKHGVEGLTKGAANEYAQFNIRINSVTPGLVKTPMASRVLGDNQEDIDTVNNRYIAMKRMADAREIANCVYWLSTTDSSYVTGHSLVVDGGLSLNR